MLQLIKTFSSLYNLLSSWHKMLHNFLTHTSLNSMSFPIVPGWRHGQLPVCCTPPPPLRSCHQLLWRPEAVAGSSSIARLTVNNKTGGGTGYVLIHIYFCWCVLNLNVFTIGMEFVTHYIYKIIILDYI